MKFSALSRTGFAVALSAVLVSMAAPVMAADQNNGIFSQVAPSFRDRLFFRLNYIYANVKTTSGKTYDVTGPVVTVDEINAYLGPNNTSGLSQGAGKAAANGTARYESPYYKTIAQCNSSGSAGAQATCRNNRSGVSIYNINNIAATGLPNLLNVAIQADVALGYDWEANGIGTPDGIKAVSDDTVGTPAVSLGYFLTNDYTWFVEGYILAAPLKVNVKGDGINPQGLPNGINGVDIITTKLLPPTFILGRYFGSSNDRFRPFAGIGASYAYFYDVRATDALNSFVGGASAGDTTVKLKNALGIGPFLGLKTAVNDDWYVNLSVGKLRYKTEATITTNNTTLNGHSAVLKDFGPNVTDATVNAADALPTLNQTPGSTVTALLCDLAATKYKNDNCNMGTFVRKQSTVLDSTLFMFSVGRSF